MTYFIGKQPTVGNFIKLDALTASATASYTMQYGGSNYSPESVNHMLVSLNGIIQEPTTSYSISSSTLTFASALTSSDSIDFIMVYGDVLNIGTPSDSTISTAKIIDDAVTQAKLADESVNEARLQVSNSPTNGYFLSAQSGNTGGLTWAEASGGDNTPYFRVDTTTQTVGSEAVLVFTNSIFDSASGYDTSNGKYTIPTGQGGYWWFQANANIGSSYTGMYFNIKVEGANKLRGVTSNASAGAVHCSGIINVSAGDEVTVALELGSSQGLSSTAYTNAFSGFKLIT